MNCVLTIARNDFRHALRDRLVWGAVVLLGAAFLPSVGSVTLGLNGPVQESVLSSAGDLVIFSLVVIAAVGYNSFTSERTDGTVRLVLGLSGTRRDLVFGKLLSRLAIVVLALGAVLVIASGLTARALGIESLVLFLGDGRMDIIVRRRVDRDRYRLLRGFFPRSIGRWGHSS